MPRKKHVAGGGGWLVGWLVGYRGREGRTADDEVGRKGPWFKGHFDGFESELQCRGTNKRRGEERRGEERW